jgi:hypothetical protein
MNDDLLLGQQVRSRSSALHQDSNRGNKLSDAEFQRYTNYSFENEEERLAFLELSKAKREDFLESKKQYLERRTYPSYVESAIAQRDLIYGMSAKAVIEAWGQPSVEEFAGKGRFQRWTYYNHPATREEKRYLYIEDGRLVGWQSF